jgi:hypothetical protein
MFAGSVYNTASKFHASGLWLGAGWVACVAELAGLHALGCVQLEGCIAW